MNLQKAKEYARKKHEGQKYGDHPYFDYHLEGVAEIIRGSHIDPKHLEECEKASYLHDVLEDVDYTGVLHFQLREIVSLETYRSIFLLTKGSNQDYFSYIKIIAESGDYVAKMVKIADLTFNIGESESMESLNSYKKQRLDKYRLARYILDK